MRLVSKLAMAGVALVAAGGAYAAEQESHIVRVPLADGSMAHIRYVGDHKPQVAIVPADQVARRAQVAAQQQQLDPVAARFAAMDAMFADMDRQMDAMMRQAAAMRQQAAAAQANGQAGGQPMMVSTGSMPAGAVSYSVVTTSNGKCSRTVETSYTAAGQAPRVVEKTSGDCGSASATPAPAPRTAPSAKPAPAAAPRTVGRNDA